MASVAGEKSFSSRKEKFGKFVLLEQLDSTTIGADYRAAKLGSAGLEKIVQLLRLTGALSASAEAAKVLMDQAKFAAQLQNGNILKIFGIGKVEGSYYISYEFVEGKTLKTIFGRCRSEGFPFSVDHALLIASKICSALEYAHGRKLDTGGRYYHGLITPNNVLVSYEGEVRVRGFGYWPSGIRELGLVGDDEIVYLAPEQAAGTGAEPRSDTFAVGAILFEALTGQPLLQPDRKQDVSLRIANARLQGPSGDEDALPKAIADILNKALAPDPGGRYAEIQEMRKAIDTLLFSGDFTPTTFNLAFFMHSLFREDIERESKVLKEEKEASYFDFLDDAKKTPLPSDVMKGMTPAPISAPATPAPPPVMTPPVMATPVPTAPPVQPVQAPVHDSHPPRAAHPVHAPAPAHKPTPVDSREAAAGFTFHKEDKAKGKSPILLIAAALLVIGVGVGLFMKFGGGMGAAPVAPTAPPVITKSPEEVAAQQKVAELQRQLDEMKKAQEDAANKAAETAKQKAIDDAKRRGQTIGAEELAKAEAAAEAARKKTEEESHKKAEEQQKQLEAQKKVAEEDRLRVEKAAAEKASSERAAADKAAADKAAADKAAADEAASKRVADASTSAPPPTSAVADTAPSGPKPRRGELVSINDAGVVKPEFVKKAQASYPTRAYAAKVGGTVVVNALIDEDGKVTDTQLLQKVEHPLGVDLNNAAIASVRSSTFKPAMKDGVPVKVWLPIPIQFRAPR